jgi:hypothetical protein
MVTLVELLKSSLYRVGANQETIFIILSSHSFLGLEWNHAGTNPELYDSGKSYDRVDSRATLDHTLRVHSILLLPSPLLLSFTGLKTNFTRTVLMVNHPPVPLLDI